MHEQSETVQLNNGKYTNVYGRKTPKSGQRLPGEPDYNTMEEAVEAAKKRSQNYNREEIIKSLMNKTRGQ